MKSNSFGIPLFNLKLKYKECDTILKHLLCAENFLANARVRVLVIICIIHRRIHIVNADKRKDLYTSNVTNTYKYVRTMRMCVHAGSGEKKYFSTHQTLWNKTLMYEAVYI